VKARLYFRFTRRMWNQLATMLDERNWSRHVRKTKTDKDIPHPWVTYNPKPLAESPFMRAEWARRPAGQKVRASQ